MRYSEYQCAERRPTRTVWVGEVPVGSGAPVSVQSMTNTHTEDVDSTVRQIDELAEVGCQIMRCAVPNRTAAGALGEVCRRSPLPLIADVHYDHNLALAAIEAGADGVRINPGNMRDRQGLRQVYRSAARAGIKIRIGVNSGSIRPRDGLRVRADDRDLAELMVETALAYCRDAEEESFGNIVLSLKASDAPTTIAAYRMAADRCDYPFHLGVTAAGPPADSIVKSSVGIGALLAEGIGDTIRVSMTGPPHEEVRVAISILEALRLREPTGPQIISCPTCARCEIDLGELTAEVKRRLEGYPHNVRVAVMGCVVNGPGEAAEADVGIAGGEDFGYLFRRGEKVRKVPASQLADALMAEVERWSRIESGREG
ncbi:MAG: flavodoxin-dependent (E)-4-hydroxy-3-methylbut-2-enyl-diphosphate synthase [Planctomycetota bacterium]